MGRGSPPDQTPRHQCFLKASLTGFSKYYEYHPTLMSKLESSKDNQNIQLYECWAVGRGYIPLLPINCGTDVSLFYPINTR